MISVDELGRLFSYDNINGLLLNKVARNYRTIVGKEAGSVWTDAKRENHRYKVVKIYGKEYKIHRIIWALHNGSFPKGQIDHIDGDTLNNRIDNLRDVDNITNSKNRAIQSNNKSGYHGISVLPSGNYRVRINDNKKRISVGTFPDFDSAYKARLEAEIKYKYHNNHGRNI